jgi:hypothetical protein
MTRYSAAVLFGAAALALQAPALARQETPAGTPASPTAEQTKPAAVTLSQITEMYKTGTPTAALLNVVNTFDGEFDATLDDVIRMQRMGMPPELLRAIALKTSKSAAGSPTSEEKLKLLQEQMERETAEAEAQLAAMDEQLRKEGVEIPEEVEPLAEKKVVKMARQPEPGPSAVARAVRAPGRKKNPQKKHPRP